MRIAPWFAIPLTVALLAATALAAVGLIPVVVTQKNRAFGVSSLDVSVGQVVRFNNDDQFRHQIYVESPNFTFESDEQNPGTAVDITFSKTGLFEVRCHIHPKMLLKVDVR